MREQPARIADAGQNAGTITGTNMPSVRTARAQPPLTPSARFHLELKRVFTALLLAIPAGLWAQSADIAGQEKTSEGDETSQHVEESEEAFRRRMETAESHDQSAVMRPRSSGTNKVPEGIDALPADSRKHLRDELRNVIIEQGEWQPEDAGKVYPYTPSAAAEKDPQLRQQEQAAWGELVQEYHKREAAALAMGGGRGGSQESKEQRTGSSAGVSGSGRKSSDPAERSASDAVESTAASAGVSQSALEFLKQQQSGAAGGQSGAEAGGASGAIAAASSQDSPSARQSQTQAPSQPPPSTAAQAAAGKPAENERSKEPDEPEALKPPPGSLAIAELAALEEKARREAEAQAQPPAAPQVAAESADNNPQQVAAMKQQSSEQPPPLPGTIAIPELEKLQGMEEAQPLAAKEPDTEP